MISPNSGLRPKSAPLKPTLTPGAQITQPHAGAWHLEIPAGAAGRYRLAQLDDYSHLGRKDFPWTPPLSLVVRARASAEDIPGTWGFGLWNDPFSLSIGLGGGMRRVPALPNAAWFFFASEHNYLSLRDDLPAQGALAATFQSTPWPAPLMALSALFLPLLLIPFTARILRRLGRRKIRQAAIRFTTTLTEWHTYRLDWETEAVHISLDGNPLYSTPLAPIGPLGLVFWVDNQYAAFPPDGRLMYGTLSNPEPAWIQIEGLETGLA
jgi:hypothetical protein